MRSQTALCAIATCALTLACGYIVFPEEEGDATAKKSKGWNAEVIQVGKNAAGDLHVDFAIRNDTTDWSTIRSVKKPARLVSRKGDETPCETVFLGRSGGGHRLAPGFRMRGYLTGPKTGLKVQPIYVECKGAQAEPGSKLSIEYSYVTGDYNYYEQGKNEVSAVMEVNLDKVHPKLTYPLAEPPKELELHKMDARFVGLNQVALRLESVQRVPEGLRFSWHAENPGEYPSYVHVGNTPVIGQDGILYGYYETPDIVPVPITPSKGTAEWTTQVAVPASVKGFYIMLSVETGKQRLFSHHAVDVSDR